MKLSPAIKKQITTDWKAHFPDLGIYKPMCFFGAWDRLPPAFASNETLATTRIVLHAMSTTWREYLLRLR